MEAVRPSRTSPEKSHWKTWRRKHSPSPPLRIQRPSTSFDTSIGGATGQQLLSEHSDRLISATLTNTGAVLGTPEAWKARSVSVLELGLSTMSVDIVPRRFGPTACKQQPALIEGWRVTMGRGDDGSYGLLCEMLAQVDFREMLGENRVPLQLIGGSDDVATPPETLKALSQWNAALDPVILEPVEHLPSVECPSLLSDLLLKH